MTATSGPRGNGTHETAGAQGMPGASMADERSGMPSGAMEGSPMTGMPEGTMDDPADSRAGGEMPSGRMTDGASGGLGSGIGQVGADDGAPRFPPAGYDPTAPGTAALVPGIVEVQFREGVEPELVRSGAPSGQLTAHGTADLTPLNDLLRRYGVRSVAPSFDTPPQEAKAVQADARRAGHTVPNLRNFYVLQFDSGVDVRQVAAELNQLAEVERAVPVPIAIPPQLTIETTRPSDGGLAMETLPALAPPPSEVRPPVPTDEPLVGTTDQVVLNPATGLENQWYIFRCGVQNAWTMSSGSNVVIADIDWGYRTTHQDLASRLDLTRAYNSYDGGTNVSHGTSISHGTAVMGITGAADNNLGIAGIAYDASLWPVQANSGPGSALAGNAWARAIDWVRTTSSGGRRKVIILEVQTGTFGNYEMVPSVNAAIQTAIAAGVVVCVAAGNGDRDAGIDDAGNPIPPTGSILVGATAYHPSQNPRASFSNFGSQVVVSAPGDPQHDLTCNSTGDAAYRNGFGGTSGATPKVAGVAALMLAADPALTHAQIRTTLNSTGTPVTTDAGKPVGTFLNAAGAVAAVGRRWRGFASLGGVCIHGPAVSSWAANRLDAFVIGTDGALFHKFWNAAAWSGWGSLGGTCISAPAAVSRGPNLIDAFVIGTDSAIWQKSWNGAAWSGWSSQGGVCMYGTAVASWGPSRLDLFTVGSNNALFQKSWNGAAWSGWNSLGGTCISAPAAVSWGSNRIDVCVIGTDNAIWHRAWTGAAWSPWTSLGGVCKRGVAISSRASNRLDVFTIGMNNHLYQRSWDGASWNAWSDLGGICISAPAAVSPSANRIDAFVYGTNSALYQNTWS